MRSGFAILLAVALSACFSPNLEDGTIACGAAGCPSGMVCWDDGYCYANPPTGGSDRRVVLAVANNNGSNRLYAYCGDNLAPVWSDDRVMASLAVAWGDGDDDGIPELALATDDSGVIVYSIGDGGPGEIASDNVPHARDVAWGRFDDGNPDLAIASAEGFRIEALRDGSWLDEWWRSQGHDGLSLAVADADGDGYDDLGAGTRGESVLVYRSDGQGSLDTMWYDGNGGDAESISWGDADGDGDPDLAIGNDGQPVCVEANRGDWFESVWQSYDSIPTTAVAWGDVDDDGWPDLAVGTNGSPLILFHNTGGGLEEAWQSDETDVTWTLDWFDMDGDGDLDLAAGQRVYRNDGGRLSLFWSADDSATTSDVAWATWQGGPDPCRW